MTRRDENPLEGASPRTLLAFWTTTAAVFNATHQKPAPSRKSRRGRKQYAKARRARALTRRLQRNSWRSYHEREKRIAAWSLDSCAYSEETHIAHVQSHGRCPGCGS